MEVLTDVELFNAGIKYETNRGEDMLNLIEDGLLRYSSMSFSDDLEGLVFPELKLIRYNDVLNEETGFFDHAVQLWWNGVLMTDYIRRQVADNQLRTHYERFVDVEVVTEAKIDACVLYICGEIVKQRNA